MANPKLIVRVATDESKNCPICDFSLDGIQRFEESCNHLLREHALRCLHVGTETHPGPDGKPWHITVASFEASPFTV